MGEVGENQVVDENVESDSKIKNNVKSDTFKKKLLMIAGAIIIVLGLIFLVKNLTQKTDLTVEDQLSMKSYMEEALESVDEIKYYQVSVDQVSDIVAVTITTDMGVTTGDMFSISREEYENVVKSQVGMAKSAYKEMNRKYNYKRIVVLWTVIDSSDGDIILSVASTGDVFESCR